MLLEIRSSHADLPAHSTPLPVPKHTQVRLIGNSVCPPLARALVEANFTHERKFMPAPAETVAA